MIWAGPLEIRQSKGGSWEPSICAGRCCSKRSKGHQMRMLR